MSKIIAITVSVYYDDYLSYCLSNSKLLDHWYIIVDPDDHPTHNLLCGYSNITMVPFNFQSDGAIFNKSGGIHKVQKMVHVKYPEAWILLLDSDIILPHNIRNILSNINLDQSFLYGAERLFYKTPEQLEKDTPVGIRTLRGCWGYFHLYYDKTKLCWEMSKDASEYDKYFRISFAERVQMLPFKVKHLGDERRNWKGRRTPRFEH
jgi:hypothetical protein